MDLSLHFSQHQKRRGVAGSPVGWLLLAVVLGFLSFAVDRTTTIEVFSDGGRIHLEVAGTVLSAPRALQHLRAVEILAMDSIDPPGGRVITITTDRTEVLRESLPRRFRIPPGEIVPVGDWELDERAGWASVWRREVDVSDPFTLKATFRGRFLHDLTVVLHGDSTTSIAVRRGLINDDCFIRDGDGFVLASTSIDPTPLADLGAIGSTCARALAAACLLIACFTMLQSGSRSRPLPAASSSWPAVPLILVIAVTAVAISAWVARDVLECLPHTPDAVVYLLQAEWFLDGGLWAKATTIHDHLSIPFTYVDNGRWLAHYPPGWPVLLALGVATGVPWMLAPLLGGAYIVLLFLAGRELDGPTLGLTAATLGLISPITRLIFGSMLSHAAASTLILAALVLALRARHSPGWYAAPAGGIALGLAFGIRPLTAAAVVVPLLVLALPVSFSAVDGARARRTVIAFLGGAGLAALPTLLANALITGSATSFPYSLARGSMFGIENIPFGIRNLDALLVSSGAAGTGWGWDLIHGPWIIALTFAPALVPLLRRRARASDWLMAATILAVLAAYVGTRGHGLHGFGPRYHFEIFAPFFLLTARGFLLLAGRNTDEHQSEKRMPAMVAFGLFLALCISAGAFLPHRLSLYRGYNGVDGSLERQVTQLAPKRALIVLPTDTWQGWAAASRMIDLRPDAPLLFIQADNDDPAIPDIAGDRPVYLWRDGRLTPR